MTLASSYNCISTTNPLLSRKSQEIAPIRIMYCLRGWSFPSEAAKGDYEEGNIGTGEQKWAFPEAVRAPSFLCWASSPWGKHWADSDTTWHEAKNRKGGIIGYKGGFAIDIDLFSKGWKNINSLLMCDSKGKLPRWLLNGLKALVVSPSFSVNYTLFLQISQKLKSRDVSTIFLQDCNSLQMLAAPSWLSGGDGEETGCHQEVKRVCLLNTQEQALCLMKPGREQGNTVLSDWGDGSVV